MVKNMMDRNREARRAAAMTNGLPRRRHRNTTTGGSLRESPEDESPMELQETAARLRDRTLKKERDREMRDRDRDRERERERDRDRDRDRLNRSKRRRSDKYLHREDGGGGGGGGDDETSEDSVNDEDEEDEDGQVPYVPPSNPTVMTSTSAASTLTSHRKSYPPPSKVIRVAPTWKAPDEMIGVSIPRKARSASTKRGHDCWSTAAGGGVGSSGEQQQQQVNINRQASPSPVRSTTTPPSTQQPPVMTSAAPPPPTLRPMSPSSSNVSIKKKIAATNGPPKPQHRPPKSSKSPSPSSVQEEIEIEVAEVLYGLMRQSHAPSKQDAVTPNDSTHKLDSRSIHHDPKSRLSPNSINHTNNHSNNNPSTSSSSTPLTTVAPKRKRPRPHPEENHPSNLGHRSSPKVETDHSTKVEAPCPSSEKKPSAIENGGELVNSQEAQAEVMAVGNNVMISDSKQGLAEESSSTGIRNGMLRAKVEEASSSPKLESPQNLDRVESSTTSTKLNSAHVEQENHREDKLEIDLMAPPPQSRASPEREEEMAEFVGKDEKCMVTDREAEAKPSTKPKLEDEKSVKSRGSGNVGGSAVELKTAEAEPPKRAPTSTVSQVELNLSGKERERNIDLQLDLEKTNVNDDKLNFQKPQPQAAPPLKTTKDESNTDTKPGGQSGSGPLPMSVPGGWHGGLPPMGYVGPLQGVVSMDGTPVASPPIQPPTPHFLFTQPRPKRCATHCYVARSISVHQQMMKMHPFWPAAAAAAAAGTAPLFGGKPYNLNMMPSGDLHGAGRGVVVNSSQDNKGQPFTFFPGQPASSSKDKSPQSTSNVSDSAQKKQFLLQPALPPGAPSNLMGPALFFPMSNQQQAVANARPTSSSKSPSTTGAPSVSAAATSAPPMSAMASNGGPAMSFSYPNMGGNEAQFMAILGNGGYPFPIPAHVGAAPYRASHPQAMSFFNGSFYSSQMLHHPSQLQQQQPVQQQQSQSMQIQQQNQPNASISTASSSSQKQLQNLQQQQRAHGNSGNMNQGLQNFQANKGRTSQPHQEVGGEDSPSTADSRNRPNMSVYGQNFAMPPFHSANFAMMTTPPSSMGGNVAGVPNGNHSDKKQQQQQQQQQTPAFPMSFATINGATTPGIDISSIAHNHAMIQSLPEAARQNYQLLAAAAAAQAQAAQQKKNNNYRGSEDGKTGVVAPSDASNIDEERKALTARAAAASVGQSIAFSRDLSDNSMPGNNVVDTSARSLNLIHGSSTRPTRSSAQNAMSNSNASSNSQQQQQQQQQMLFSKQQQYVGPSAGNNRSKTPTTTNGNVYPDHLTSPSIMAAKFPNSLSGFPLVQQTSGASVQSTPWKNSVRPNTSQASSPTMATSNSSNIKNLPQQGRTQQNHTQISFGGTAANPKTSSTSQGQQAQSNNQVPASPMVVGSPSTSSVSKGASGSPRTNANASTVNKAGGQASSLSSQQGKNSQSPSLSSQKPSLLGSPHHIMSNSNSGNKPQLQQSQQQQQPQLSKQAIQQTQLFFSHSYMQAKSAAMATGPYYLPRHRPDNQQQQQQQQQQHGSTSQGMGHTTSSSGMLTLCTPVSIANSSTSDPAKAVAAAAAAANSMKGGLPSQGIFHAAQFAAQSAGGAHQLMPAGYPYVHAVSTAVQAKPTEQKQPAGE